MALIDKETIRAEIERREKIIRNSANQISDSEKKIYYSGGADSLLELLPFLDTLPESAKRGYKDCNGCKYNRTVKDQIGWQFRGCFGGEYKGKPIAEIELCPLKAAALPEQPWVEIEKELDRYLRGEFQQTAGGNFNNYIQVARHFAEWQKEQDTRDLFMSDNRHFNKVYELGKKDMKAKMMEKAVGGRYMKAYSKVYVESWPLDIDPDSVKAGDEVRLIVIPEESEKVK